MESKTKEQLLAELSAYVRSASEGGKTTAADVRQFLISLTEELFIRTDGQTSNFIIEQDLTSNSSTSAPSVQAVKGALEATAADNLANTGLAISASSLVDRDRANHTGTQTVASISDFTSAVAGLLSVYDAQLKDGVVEAGNTLQKLYNLIIGQFSEVTVATIAARNSYKVSKLPTNVFVTDDGDGKWALYRATSTGTNASYVKLSDPDLMAATMTAAQVKAAYESNPDTNALTNALLSKLNGLSNYTDAQAVAAALSSPQIVKTNDARLIKPTVEQALTSNSTTNIPSVKAVKTAVDLVNTVATNAQTTANTANSNAAYKFIGKTRNGLTIYSDYLEDLFEDPRMRFGIVRMNCFGYFMIRNCSNTQVEMLQGPGYIWTNGFTLKLPMICYDLLFHGGNLIAGEVNLVGYRNTTRIFNCQIHDGDLEPTGRNIELINCRVETQYFNSVQWATGAGAITLLGTSYVQSNLTVDPATTIVDSTVASTNLLLRAPTQSAGYNLAVTDRGKVVPIDSPSDVKVMIPFENPYLFPIGFVAEISQEGNGKVVIAGETDGVVLQYFGGLKTAGKYASVQVLKIANNVWRITNGIA